MIGGVSTYRIRYLVCPPCDEQWRVRCKLIGESELTPNCPECDGGLLNLNLKLPSTVAKQNRVAVERVSDWEVGIWCGRCNLPSVVRSQFRIRTPEGDLGTRVIDYCAQHESEN